ncbi:hypothetical protein C2G38_596615 [Gigaspora rosea]|uniref:Uncharacterized protein n=1 Tax=Gigaspora rosea TaxID=44941 RepID=A0A397U6U9_9GLOM|nr:hypothetical protein C2G38_596615 [Gigaspora rosea]
MIVKTVEMSLPRYTLIERLSTSSNNNNYSPKCCYSNNGRHCCYCYFCRYFAQCYHCNVYYCKFCRFCCTCCRTAFKTCRCVHCHRCSGYFGDGETPHSPGGTLELCSNGKRFKRETNIKETNVNNVNSNNLSSNNDEPYFDIYQYFSSLKLEDPNPLEK